MLKGTLIVLATVFGSITAEATVLNRQHDKLRFENLPLCLPESVINYYLVDEPPKCENLSEKKTTSFLADIIPPAPTLYNVKAVACSLKFASQQFTRSFFGGTEAGEQYTRSEIPTKQRCETWRTEYRDLELGKLKRLGNLGEGYSTTHKIVPRYVWPTTRTVTVKNALMIPTELAINSLTSVANHFIDRILSCDFNNGTCKSNTALYLFEPFSPRCKNIDKAAVVNTEVLVHRSAKRTLFQVPQIDLAFSQLTTCPTRIRECLDSYKTLLCTGSHFVVASNYSEANLRSYENKSSLNNSLEKVQSDTSPLIIAQALQSVTLVLDREVTLLRDQMLKLQCQNTRVLLANLQSSRLIDPSTTLSILLNREAYAVAGPSALQEIACMKTTAVLEPSLWEGGQMASRPIFRIKYGEKIRRAQWTEGRYLRWDLRDFRHPHNGTYIINIQGKKFAFVNGTLSTKELPIVRSLGLSDSPLPLEHATLDTLTLAEAIRSSV